MNTNTNTNDILEPETNMFWTSYGYGLRKTSRVAVARMTTPQHKAWEADFAYTTDDLSAMVQRMLNAEQHGEAAKMMTCWQVEERYAELVAPIAHLRTTYSNISYEVKP